MDSKTATKFAGHLGFLTPDQKLALDRFKQLLKSKEMDSVPNMQEDTILLRFLRARKFDPDKALKQFSDTVAWRKKHDVDNLYAGFETEEFEMSKHFYPRWTGRRDKWGTPLYVYKISSLTSEIQSKINAVAPSRRYERIVALYEFMCHFAFPLTTSLPRPVELEKTPVCNSTSIIDLEGVSLKQIWGLRNHLQEASALATANYPETLGTVIVVNSPSFFPTVWNWIKGYFDEGTREKVHVLSKNMRDTLVTLVDPEHLPKMYGGELEWQFNDEPSLDEHAAHALGTDGVPKGPVKFVDGAVTRP